jgi:hypothetical protein
MNILSTKIYLTNKQVDQTKLDTREMVRTKFNYFLILPCVRRGAEGYYANASIPSAALPL